jgi:hypothetical protein
VVIVVFCWFAAEFAVSAAVAAACMGVGETGFCVKATDCFKLAITLFLLDLKRLKSISRLGR